VVTKTKGVYIALRWRALPVVPILVKFGLVIEIVHVIICARFCEKMVTGKFGI